MPAALLCVSAVAICMLLAGKMDPTAGREENKVAIIGETLAWEGETVKMDKQQRAWGRRTGKTEKTRIHTLYDVPLDDGFQEWLAALCGSRGLEYRTIVAMADQESGFTPDAIGSGGELGMWQIMPETAREAEEALGRSLDLFDPYDNADCATWLMAKYMAKYGNDIHALFAYSMGEAGADKCLAGSRPRSLYAVSVLEKAAGYVPRRNGEAEYEID